MDLIGRINYIANRLDERRPKQGKGKPAPRNARNNTADEKNDQADSDRSAMERNSRLGRKIDIIV